MRNQSKSKKFQHLLRAFAVVQALLSPAIVAPSPKECFEGQRFPKVIQSNGGEVVNYAQAVTVLGDEAVFSGGYVPQPGFAVSGAANSVYAQVGRINIGNRQWAWSKLLAESTQTMKDISGLALNSAGTDLAVYARDSSQSVGWVFVLDTASGQPLSAVGKIDTGNTNQKRNVSSYGLVFHGNMVYMAMNHIGSVLNKQDAYEQRLMFRAFDTATGTITLSMRNDDGGYGKSSAFLSANGHLYLGGSYDASNNERWGLSITRIWASGASVDANISILHYEDDDSSAGCSSNLGFQDVKEAPFIEMMSYDTTLGLIFGTTNTHNHDGSEQGKNVLVFTVALDANGDASTATGDLVVKKLSSNYDLDSTFIGMHPSLQSSSGQNYIHAIFDQGNLNVYYIRMSVDPSDFSDFKAHRLNDVDFNAKSAFFTATVQGTVGNSNSYSGFQAYIAGQSHDRYKARQWGSDEDLKQDSYMILPTFEDTHSCVDINHLYSGVGVSNRDECLAVIVQSMPFATSSGAALQISVAADVEFYDMDWTNQFDSEKCSLDDEWDFSLFTSSTFTVPTQCYGYGAIDSVTFPPLYQKKGGSECTDEYFIYRAYSTGTALPTDIALSVDALDQTTPKVMWGIKDNSASGFDTTRSTYIGTYTVEIIGQNQGYYHDKLVVGSFQLEINACMAPNVITPPTPSSSSFTYALGDTLNIPLSPFTTLSTHCTLAMNVPTVSPADTLGIFFFAGDNLTTTVSTTDPAAIQTYTLTFSTVASDCVASQTVSYDVVVDDPCPTAFFTIDSDGSTFPSGVGAIAQTFTLLVDTSLDLVWSTASDVVSSLGSATTCGSVVQELVATSADGSTESAYDTAIFTEDLTGAGPKITTSTTDDTVAGLHYFRLKVYYSSYQSQTEAQQDFIIEIQLPCLTTTLSIDDSVLKAEPAISATQYINYASVQLAWSNDSIVQSSIAVGTVCGGYTYQLSDVTSAPQVLDPDVFPLVDITSANKYIDVHSTDFTKLGTYKLQIDVQFTNWPSGPSASKTFLVDLVDYCVPTSVTPSAAPSDLTYYVGATKEESTFTPWAPVPAVCNLTYLKTVAPSNPGNQMVAISTADRKVSVEGSDVFYGGDHLTGSYTPGVYTVTIKAQDDNSGDTSTTVTMTVTILDPCDPDVTGSNVPNITILATIISPNPIEYIILDPLVSHVLSNTSVTETVTTVTCPLIQLEVTNLDLSIALDSIFTWDFATQTLDIHSVDMNDLATLTRDLKVAAYYQGGAHKTYGMSGHLDIQVELVSPCDNPHSVTAPADEVLTDYFYTGATSLVTFDLTDPFAVDPVECQPEFVYTCTNTGSRTDICAMNEDGGATLGDFDAASEVFTLQTTNMVGVPPDTYVVSIQGTVGSGSATKTFTFDLVDPCPTLALIAINQEILTGTVTHIFRDPFIAYPWDYATDMTVSGISVDGNCGNLNVSFFLNDGSETSLDTVIFTNDSGPPTQFLINQIDDPPKAGVYDITYKVYLEDYNSVQVVSSTSMVVTVLDPCKSPTATITAPTLIDQLQVVGFPDSTYSIDLFTVYASWCTVTYSATSSEPTLDSVLFSFDDTTHTFTFLETHDLSLAGAPQSETKQYTITVSVVLDILISTADFVLTIKDPCNDPLLNQIHQPSGPFASLEYIVGTEAAEYDFQAIAGGSFYSTIDVCDDAGIYFTANLWFEATDEEVEVNDFEGSVVLESETGVFSVFTMDNLLLGANEIRFEAHLTAYPEMKSLVEMVVPIEYQQCILQVQDWYLHGITLPYNVGSDYQFEAPVLDYPHAFCPFPWSAYHMRFFDASNADVTALTNDISLDEALRVMTISARQNVFLTKISVEITAELADLFTNVTSTFQVYYGARPILNPENTPPILVTGVLEEYTRVGVSANSTNTEIEPVVLGSVYDLEGDDIKQTFKCISCKDESDITYNEQTGKVSIRSGISYGAYRVELRLSDNNEDAKKKRYSFNIKVFEPIVFDQAIFADLNKDKEYKKIEWVPPTVEQLEGKEEPTFSLVSLGYTGLLEVSFSQKMIVPFNLTVIDDSIFELELLVDQTSFSMSEPEKLQFTWTVESYGEKGMEIQLEFADTAYISAGENRDKMRATVRDPAYFQSQETYLAIPMNSTDIINIQKQMANTAFSLAFNDFNNGFGDFSNGALLGNFILNLLLSGAINLLWGLLHSMQIIAHFPLINIMMPANASLFFQVIVKIATFDILPTEQFIESGEASVGLKRDELVLSDTFVDYGFDSTDPIRSLQIMFLFLVFLVTYPVVSILLRGLCFCSNRCKGCLNRLDKGMFWGTYIRFTLEAYLELQIVILLRFRNFSWEDGSQIFHTIFCLTLMLITWCFLLFALYLVLCKPQAIKDNRYPSIADLFLGLNTKSKTAMVSPVIFMLRRILYAGLCVFWFERSYFQIQFLIFKQSLSMLYSGQFDPQLIPSQNVLELTNEALTLYCTYSLIMFSAFVPDANTRYLCGWQLIAIVCAILVINLIVILFSSGKLAIRRCKLKCIRKRRIREARQRQKQILRQHTRMKIAQQTAMEDQFYQRGLWPNGLSSLDQGQSLEVKVSRRNGRNLAQKSLPSKTSLLTQQSRKNGNLSSIQEVTSSLSDLSKSPLGQNEKAESFYEDDALQNQLTGQFTQPSEEKKVANTPFMNPNRPLNLDFVQKEMNRLEANVAVFASKQSGIAAPSKKYPLNLKDMPIGLL